MHHPGHARVRTAGRRQHVRTLAVLKQAPSAHHGRISLADVIVGHPGRDLTLITSRLVDQCGDDRRKTRRVEALPGAKAQALSRQQVLLGVQPLEVVALGGHRGAPLGEVSQFHQKLADAVKSSSNRVAPALDRASDLVGLTAQPPPAFGPACMVLTLGTRMAGVGAHLPAQLADPLLLLGTYRAGMPRRWRVVRHLDPHGRRKVLA